LILVLLLLIAFSMLQDPLLAIALPVLGRRLTVAALQAKDVLTYLLVIWLAVTNRNRRPAGPLLLAFALFADVAVAALFASTGVPLASELASAQSILTPVALLLLGWLAGPSDEQLGRLLSFAVWLSLASAVFGCIELFFLPNFWATIGLPAYFTQIKDIPAAFMRPGTGLPYNFWFSTGGQFTRRLVGLSASSLTTGYGLIIPMLALALRPSRAQLSARLQRWWLPVAITLLIATLLTATRGAVACLFLALIYLTCANRRTRAASAALVALIVALVFLVPAAHRALSSTLNGSDGSTPGHVAGVAAAWHAILIHPFAGSGLATAGASSSFGGNAIAAASENSYLVDWVELGLVGLAMVALIFVIAGRRLFVRSPTPGNFVALARASLVVVLGSGVISEQLSTYSTFLVAWLVIGAVAAGRGRDRVALP
jgi:O-antigen ligase